MLCPLIEYVVSDSIVARAGINPSHLIIGLCHKGCLVHEVRNRATHMFSTCVQSICTWQSVNYEGFFLYLVSFVTSLLNLLEAGFIAGAAARGTEHEANDGMCRELGWVCVPMVVEAYGAWGAEAMESLSCLASRLATSSNKAKAAVLNSLYGRLNLNLYHPLVLN